MARVQETRTFVTEAEANDFAQGYLQQYAGPFNPYEGRAQVLPPNDDRPRWLVTTSRNDSAE